MTGPAFTEEMLDNLNLSLFELSDNEVTDPQAFIADVTALVAPSGIVFNEDIAYNVPEIEVFPEVGSFDGKPIYLYVVHSYRDGAYASHAELVTYEELQSIFRFANMKIIEDNEDALDSLFSNVTES